MKKKRLITLGAAAAVLVVAGFLLVQFARGAEPVAENRTTWLTSTLIAHKGIHDNDKGLIENSMPAFAETVAKGYAIELDVQLTKDKQLVVFHDKKLKRMFGKDEYLSDLTYQELSQLRLANSSESVPLFSDVLSFVDGKVPILIEIKNEGEIGELESMLYEELKDYDGQYAVQSFNPFSVKWFRDNAPEVLRGQLSGSFIITDYDVEYAGTTRLPWYKQFLLSNLLLDFESKPNFIAYETENVDESDMENLRKLDVPVLGWVIDDEEEYERVKSYFDNFIVNTVELK
ncbi:MAG: glycerophosphodiester phosphodiesterase [Firmicutes bacterium]|nr:glycerophosphodiester phosphodiesterase [Bacillota bacterium]